MYKRAIKAVRKVSDHFLGLFKFGNKKLPKTTAIFSITPALLCVADALGMCALSKVCYAKRAEIQYDDSFPYKLSQMDFWINGTADEFVEQFRIETQNRRTPTTHLRFDEAGDFIGAKCVTKLSEIAKKLPDVKIYTYTARKDLKERGCFENLPENVTIQGSGFMVHNEFTAAPEDKIEELRAQGEIICGMDCTKCDLCSIRHGQKVYVPEH